MKTIKAIGFIGALAFSAAASAVSVTWNTNQPGISEQAAGVSLFCGSTSTCQASNATGLTGSIIKLTAWSTATLADAVTSPVDTGAWLAAKIAIFGGNGIGISNTVVGASQPRDGSGNEVSPGQHGIDNRGVDDILVVDFNPLGLANNSNWDVSSFTLGFMCNIDAAGSGCNGTLTAVDVDAWVGAPTGTFGLANEAFSGGAGSTLPGFTALTLTPDPSTSTVRTDATVPNHVGQFLVITPGLGGYSDEFKIGSIVANTPTGNQAAPLPGTVPLLALGFLSFMLTHRRFSKITK